MYATQTRKKLNVCEMSELWFNKAILGREEVGKNTVCYAKQYILHQRRL